jgi:putative ABC transport system permease protein
MQRNINENTDLQAATPAIEINRVYSLMNSGEKALRILAVAIIVVSALSVFISLFTSLKDRKYEFALMRVMGGRPRNLFTMILVEGMLISIMGAILGLVLSHVIVQLMPSLMGSGDQYQLSGFFFLTEELLLIVGALLIGILAALLPAISAARTDISDTLAED